MLRSRVTRNLPVTIVCPNTRHRIINQVIYEEFISALWSKRRNWTPAAHQRLLEYDIDLSEGVLKSYKTQIRNGTRDPVSSPSFSGELFNGNCSSRYGKDGMYKQFELWRRFYANPDGKYVGLPANQILLVNRDFGANNVFACERNIQTARFMKDLQRHFSRPPHAQIIVNDIFSYLETTRELFSVFDFDLMCQVNTEGLLERLAATVARTMDLPAVVNVATTVGRWITNSEYKDIMPDLLIEELSQHGVGVIDSFSGGYNDRIIPMRYEFLALDGTRREY